MQIDKIIRKVILETINKETYPKGLSNEIRRRVSASDLEKAFTEAQNYITFNFKNPKHPWNKQSMIDFKRILLNVLIDEIHYELWSKFPEDSKWYDKVNTNLRQVYNDRIEDVYFNVVRA